MYVCARKEKEKEQERERESERERDRETGTERDTETRRHRDMQSLTDCTCHHSSAALETAWSLRAQGLR